MAASDDKAPTAEECASFFRIVGLADAEPARPDDPSWLLKVSRRAVENERLSATYKALFSQAQSIAASVTLEQHRVRSRPTVRWRWSVNWPKVASLQVAAALCGSVAL